MGLKQRIQAFAAWKPEPPLGVPAERYYPLYVNSEWALTTVDELVAKKGLAIYREMEDRDDQVASCLGLLKFARMASGWEITAVSQDETDKRAAEFVRYALDRMRGYSVTRLLMESMDALGVGFSIQERLWSEPYEAGDFRGMRGYGKFRPLPQETITFKHDEFGELEPDGVWQAKPGQMVSPGTAPQWFDQHEVERFVLWSWRKRWNNPLGMSILRPAHPWYEFKRFTLKHWARYTERYGLPRGMMKMPSTASPTQMAEAVEALRRYQSDLAIAYRDGANVDFTEPSTSATMNFESNITAANKGIAHACFLPSTILDNTEGGSYALATAQKSTFTWVLDNLGELLTQEVMQDQVIRPLIDFNFGPQVECPKFQFRDFSQPDRESLARMYQLMTTVGMPLSKTEIREVLGVREPVDQTDVVIPPAPQPAGAITGPGFSPAMTQEEAQLNALIEDLALVGDDRDARIAVLKGQRP